MVVQTGTAVTRIDAAGGRVHGVRLAGVAAPVPADVVVANVDALTVYRDLLPHAAPAGRPDRPQPGRFRAAARRPRQHPALAHHNVFFPRDYDAEFDAVFGDPGRGVRARPAADPTVFVTVADDPTVRPAGHEAWFVLVNAASAGHRRWRGRLATPGAGRRVRRPDPGRAGRARRGRARPAAVPRDPHTGRPGRGDRRAGRRDLRHRRRAAPPGQPGPGRTGCGWSAAPATPAAACRW